MSIVTTGSRPPTVDARFWVPSVPVADSLDDEFVTAAARGVRDLPPAVDDAIVRFAERPDRSGALLIENVPVGHLPPTPSCPIEPTDKSLATEFVLLVVARRLGQPVGYLPEHGGRIVQNIVPTEADADGQLSTSSRSNLMFHTETAFHPHRPRYLLLSCLRGDPAARTTLMSVFDLFDVLDPSSVDVMYEPRFRTAVDASFLGGRRNELGPARPLLSGTRDEPTFVYDADLTTAIDDVGDRVLTEIADAIATHQSWVVLNDGDLLIVDNNVAVHGRSPFPARFDGTDRWLQRAFVVPDLAPSAADRAGRVITTEFGRVG